MRKPLAVILVLFAGATASAAAPEHWIELRSQHFVVLTDSNEKDARRIASQFERMRAVFHTLLPKATADSGKITVLALKDKKSFAALEPAPYLAKGQLNLAGLFLRSTDKSYILVQLDIDPRQEHPYATVYHEYTHLLNSNSEWLPLWLNEGLAEFYQNTDINEKDVHLGQGSADDILYLRQNRLLPLATLFTVDQKSPYYHDEEKGSVFYAESWALTHLLIVNDRKNNTHLLHDYFVNLTHGQDSLTAAQAAFGDLKKLQQQLDSYVSQFSFSMFEMKLAFPIDESSFKIRPLPLADADAVRADVLVRVNRQDEALALLQSVLRDDPKNAVAYETLGFLKMRQNDFPAARKAFDQAVQLDSQSALAQYYSAVLALREGDTSHESTIESSLLASIKLDPTFAPSYDALANLYSNRHEKLDEAHLLNVQAIELDPSNVSYRVNSASVFMQRKQPDNALIVLREADRVASTPADHAMVRARREQIEAYVAQIAKFKADHPGARESDQGNGDMVVTVSSSSRSQLPAGSIVVTDVPDDPQFPSGPPTGPQHIARGVLHSVKCYAPTVLSLVVEPAGKPLILFTKNYFKVDFYTLNFTPTDTLNVCKDIEGMKAAVTYTEVTDKAAAGQIVKVELSK